MIITPRSTSKHYRQQGVWGDQQLHELLFAHAKQKPDNYALVDPLNKMDLTGQEAQRLTFSQTVEKIEHISTCLYEQGIGKDDILLVQMPNTVELVMLYLAASKLGAIISPVPMQYLENELSDIIQILQPKAVIGVAWFKQKDAMQTLLTAIDHNQTTLSTLPKSLCWGEHTRCGNLEVLINTVESTDAYHNYTDNLERSGDDILTICWTSGTEGLPKGIPRSHNQWLTVGLATYQGNQIQEGETLLNPFPFINMASIGGLFLSWLYSGGKLVLHHPLELPIFLQQIVEEKVSYTLVPPALLNGLLKNEALLAQCDFSGIRAIGSGSAPLDSWMVEGYKQRFDIEVVNHFGSNEGVCLLCGPNETDAPDTRARLFPRAHDNLISRLVDPDTHKLVNVAGQQGELQIQGPTVFDGYYKDAEKTALSFTDDGFFKTGDLFEISKENNEFYRFVGRCKDLIIRGGMNISPAELDNLLNAHPRISEAAVAGYACELMGERVAAYVVSNDEQPLTLDDIVSYLKAKHVAPFKFPEDVINLSSLPRNPLGKVVRNQLPTATQNNE
ncbi:MAG: 2,3-dihydroxybenzoate-AMP ligase [Cellvibrionaceae bacterium]|nr:2,3-dihydroxybenzoate-AMP ligase [Cellvibrionaceae bacterium]|tara:strand:- start:7948 stop:9624 length:1677 start_codon:yes stop_codon:yes gene_type:complete